MPTTKKKWISNPPMNCEICGLGISDTFIDGKLKFGPWACICPECHQQLGVGLGTGLGQKYELIDDEWIKVEG